jgi:hypothetical protein
MRNNITCKAKKTPQIVDFILFFLSSPFRSVFCCLLPLQIIVLSFFFRWQIWRWQVTVDADGASFGVLFWSLLLRRWEWLFSRRVWLEVDLGLWVQSCAGKGRLEVSQLGEGGVKADLYWVKLEMMMGKMIGGREANPFWGYGRLAEGRTTKKGRFVEMRTVRGEGSMWWLSCG